MLFEIGDYNSLSCFLTKLDACTGLLYLCYQFDGFCCFDWILIGFGFREEVVAFVVLEFE